MKLCCSCCKLCEEVVVDDVVFDLFEVVEVLVEDEEKLCCCCSYLCKKDVEVDSSEEVDGVMKMLVCGVDEVVVEVE